MKVSCIVYNENSQPVGYNQRRMVSVRTQMHNLLTGTSLLVIMTHYIHGGGQRWGGRVGITIIQHRTQSLVASLCDNNFLVVIALLWWQFASLAVGLLAAYQRQHDQLATTMSNNLRHILAIRSTHRLCMSRTPLFLSRIDSSLI